MRLPFDPVTEYPYPPVGEILSRARRWGDKVVSLCDDRPLSIWWDTIEEHGAKIEVVDVVRNSYGEWILAQVAAPSSRVARRLWSDFYVKASVGGTRYVNVWFRQRCGEPEQYRRAVEEALEAVEGWERKECGDKTVYRRGGGEYVKKVTFSDGRTGYYFELRLATFRWLFSRLPRPCAWQPRWGPPIEFWRKADYKDVRLEGYFNDRYIDIWGVQVKVTGVKQGWVTGFENLLTQMALYEPERACATERGYVRPVYISPLRHCREEAVGVEMPRIALLLNSADPAMTKEIVNDLYIRDLESVRIVRRGSYYHIKFRKD